MTLAHYYALPNLNISHMITPTTRINTLRNAHLLNHTHLVLQFRFSADTERHAPSQLYGIDLLRAVTCIPYLNRLCDAPALLGGQLAATLWLELQFETLRRLRSVACLEKERGHVDVPWLPRAGSEALR